MRLCCMNALFEDRELYIELKTGCLAAEFIIEAPLEEAPDCPAKGNNTLFKIEEFRNR